MKLIIKAFYDIRDKLYGSRWTKIFSWGLISVLYVGLLLWFANYDIFASQIADDGNDLVHLFVTKHANFLMLVTNLGLLLILFLDICLSKSNEFPLKVAVAMNLIGVMSCITSFHCALGYVKPCMHQVGFTGSLNGCICSYVIFCVVLLYLKFNSR